MIDTFADIPTAALVAVHMDPPNQVPGIGDGMILEEPTADAVDALRAALAPWANGRDYGNFREQPGPAERFYDRDTLARLRSIVDRWDPAQLLQANHSVR